MDLPSKSIEKAVKDKSLSTVIYHNKKWFDEGYISRTSEVPEERKGKLLQVGKMYSYNYDPKYKDILAFYDFAPVMICIGHVQTASGQLNALGINISYIPPKIRPLVLDKIFKIFRGGIEASIKQVKKSKVATKEIPLNYEVCKQILKDSGFEFAIRSYIYTRMKTEPRIVTYEDWWKPSTFPSEFIEKMNIRAIYALYKKSLDPNYRIGKKDPRVEIAETNVKKLRMMLEKRKG